MYKVMKRTCWAIVLPIRSFFFRVLVAVAIVVCFFWREKRRPHLSLFRPPTSPSLWKFSVLKVPISSLSGNGKKESKSSVLTDARDLRQRKPFVSNCSESLSNFIPGKKDFSQQKTSLLSAINYSYLIQHILNECAPTWSELVIRWWQKGKKKKV